MPLPASTLHSLPTAGMALRIGRALGTTAESQRLYDLDRVCATVDSSRIDPPVATGGQVSRAISVLMRAGFDPDMHPRRSVHRTAVKPLSNPAAPAPVSPAGLRAATHPMGPGFSRSNVAPAAHRHAST